MFKISLSLSLSLLRIVTGKRFGVGLLAREIKWKQLDQNPKFGKE